MSTIADPEHVLSYLPKFPTFVPAHSIAADVGASEEEVDRAISKLRRGYKPRKTKKHDPEPETGLAIHKQVEGLETVYCVAEKSWGPACRRSQAWFDRNPQDAPAVA